MALAGFRAVLVALLILGLHGGITHAADADKQGGILRGLVHGLTPDSPEELEEKARAARDASEAFPIYETLHSNHGSDEEGIRASLWLGRYHYGAGLSDAALGYFETARRRAKGSELEAEATFWCEQTRLLVGHEPLPMEEAERTRDFWGTMRMISRIDRSIRQGRYEEASSDLLSLREGVQRAGLYGLDLVRWADLLRLQGEEQVSREVMQPLIRASAGLPERLCLERPCAEPTETVAPIESWSLQFGSYLDSLEASTRQEVLRELGLDVRIDEMRHADQTFYRVRLGNLPSRAEIDSFAAEVSNNTDIQFSIVRRQ